MDHQLNWLVGLGVQRLHNLKVDSILTELLMISLFYIFFSTNKELYEWTMVTQVS